MTKDELIFKIETLQPFEFKYNGFSYNMIYDKSPEGATVIKFGRVFEEKPFLSFGELMNQAKVENHFFKDMLDVL